VVKPTSYVKGSKIIFHTKPSDEIVDIDDDVASKLGPFVERVGTEPKPEQEQPQSEPAAEQKPRERNKQ
jgi:hypothetical protein